MRSTEAPGALDLSAPTSASTTPAPSLHFTEGGTCDDPHCPMHGFCHHGCGARTRVVPAAHRALRYTKGMPVRFLAGHSPRSKGNMNRSGTTPEWRQTADGIEVARLRRWLFPLRERYGSVPALGEVMGVPLGTLNGLLYGTGRKRASKELSERIVRFVAAHHRPSDPLAVFDIEARRLPLPTERERAAAEARRRYLAEGVPSENTKPWTAPITKRELVSIKRTLARQGGPRRREEEAAGEGVTTSRYPDHPWRQDRYGKARYDSPSQKEAV